MNIALRVLGCFALTAALGLSLAALWPTKNTATEPAPKASTSARGELERERVRRDAFERCTKVNGTVVMGFGFQVICLDPDLRSETTDIETGRRVVRGHMRLPANAEPIE